MTPAVNRSPRGGDPHRSGSAWRRYAAPVALVAGVAAVLAIVLSTVGGSGSSSGPKPAPGTATASAPPRPAAPPRTRRAARLAFHDSGLRLPAPLRSEASVTLPGGQALLVGGNSSGGVATAAIEWVTTTEVAHAGRLPQPLSEGAGAAISGTAYVFGGGGRRPSAAIVRVDPSGGGQMVDRLPRAVTGAGAGVVGGTAYVVGGFDGTHYLSTVVAWEPSVGAHIVATVPVGLRDPAVAVVGGQLVIAGGTSAKGPSKALYGFDPASAQVAGITPLPAAVTHAMAAVVHGRVFVIGGEASVQGTQTDTILEYDPVTAHVSMAGRLPTPLSDAGVAVIGGQILLAGGIDDAGQVHDQVWLGSLGG